MQTEYHAFVDGDVGRCGAEATKLLDGSTMDAKRVQLVLVDDLDALCAGLDPEVVAQIRDFASQATRRAPGRHVRSSPCPPS